MARQRQHLSRAPIVEAIIDFRVSRPEQLGPDVFLNLEKSIGEQYGNKSPIKLLQGFFGIDNGQPREPSQIQTDLGWRYQSEHEVAQFRLDGFTFNRLEPYTTWNEVFGEAFRLWEIYRELAKPEQVSRLAVRYVNRMRLAGVELGRYLEAPPKLPPPMPQRLREFLTRVYVGDDESDASAVVVQALEQPLDRNADSVSILLDIDAFREVPLPPDDASLPGIFERLRTLKNTIFYASVTEATVEMYE